MAIDMAHLHALEFLILLRTELIEAIPKIISSCQSPIKKRKKKKHDKVSISKNIELRISDGPLNRNCEWSMP